ncbi:hypothetical protein GQF42_04385 [Streptomyces broussonetiae]|uniref:Thiamine pyrophosphate enzyme TPP-binding domain-containing protein n=2 Tax=Streptomyces broussonetiae TaxID=2686304 RepID=A0A6I6MWN3_9ACTN|nr:thiamine pyrophosphate-dependent enzyme [Streptomyces broussonetiae]QHA02629.1 hypothetical protein GQF42_04385 [Streptomyces broussonetiae]
MAQPRRPVAAVVGDGSALCRIPALWTATQYDAGAVCVVLANGRCAVMDKPAERPGGTPSWLPFEEIRVAGPAEPPTPPHPSDHRVRWPVHDAGHPLPGPGGSQ